jgi:hypothetical protein
MERFREAQRRNVRNKERDIGSAVNSHDEQIEDTG